MSVPHLRRVGGWWYLLPHRKATLQTAKCCGLTISAAWECHLWMQEALL